MNPELKVLILAIVLMAGETLGASEIPEESEYAWQFPIRIEAPAEFLAVGIPLDVYRSVSDPELRDIGVYNAAGEAVPRTFQQVEEKVDDVELGFPLGMVPLYGELAESERRLRLLMQLNDAGTSLQFASDLPEPADPQLELRAIIVDFRDREETLSALDFQWPEQANGFIGTVVVEDGDDLGQWRRLATGTLAELEFEGTRIEQRRLEIPRETGDFLRITWRDMPRGWRIASVSGISRQRGADLDREWLTLDAVERSEDGREYVFDLAGYPPVDRIKLVLPGRNVVVRASIESRIDGDSGWRLSHEGLFYRVSRNDNEIEAGPARLAPSRASQWRVKIYTGQVSDGLKLRVGWRPDQMLFLAQGEGPYSLATGRAMDRIENFPQQRLLGDRAIFNMLQRSGEAGSATVGARLEGAGAMVMEGARTWTWRTALVWIGLVAAVAFVGWLAWSLMRETKET
jgi:hypothetical protein